MNPQIIDIEPGSGAEWTVGDKTVTVPEDKTAGPYLLAYATAHYPPGTVARLHTEEGTRDIVLRTRANRTAPAAVVVPPAPAAKPEPAADQDAGTTPNRKARKLILIAAIAAAVLALAAVVIVPNLAGSTPEVSPQWNQEWAIEPDSGPVSKDASQITGAGVLLNVSGGAVEAYHLADGAFIGSALAPKDSRVGVGPDFVVLSTAGKGTSSGAVITAEGIDTFDQEPGTLIRRGTVPFLAGGKGAEQYALLYSGGQWGQVGTPIPGLAPLAVTEQTILWLGTDRRIITTDHAGKVTSKSTLETPPDAAKVTQRAFATNDAIGIVWTTEAGDKTLVTHSPKTGKILRSVPVKDEVFYKAGGFITATAGGDISRWRLTPKNQPEPITGDCPVPVPAGGLPWCPSAGIYTAPDGQTLPAGTIPIPSTTEAIPATSGKKLTLYSR